MADYGLLKGLAEGLKSGVESYRSTKKDAEERALNKRLMMLKALGTDADYFEKTWEHLPPELLGEDVSKYIKRDDEVVAPEATPSGLLASNNDADAIGLIQRPGAVERPGLIVDPYDLSKLPRKSQQQINEKIFDKNMELKKTGEEAKFNTQTRQYEVKQVGLTGRAAEEYEAKKIEREQERRLREASIAAKERERLPTDAQFKAATFGTRAAQADKIMSDLAASGYDRTSKQSAAAAGFLGLVPGGESVKSSQLKQQEQAETNFVTAVLRKESGATITPQEFATAEKQYFPRVGDSPEVLAQKAQNRAQAIEGLRAEGMPALAKMKTVPLEAAAQTRIVDGITYKKVKGGWQEVEK